MNFSKDCEKREGENDEPFDETSDYLRYVDGKPRYDGVADFLSSRNIKVPYGGPEDPPEADTICGIGNRKNLHFLKYLETHGAEAYVTTIEFIRSMRSKEKGVALISASRNAKNVLRLSGLMDLFDVIIDGTDSERLGIHGKPAPDIFLEAARRLGTVPPRSAIIEDALAGVEAGRSGGFGLVIGLDRGSHEDELREHGADVVVKDLSDLWSKEDPEHLHMMASK